MPISIILKFFQNILIAFGGWCAGGELATKIGEDKHTFTAKIIGMTLAGILSRYTESSLQKEEKEEEKEDLLISSNKVSPYRSDHADRLTGTNEKQSSSIQRQ